MDNQFELLPDEECPIKSSGPGIFPIYPILQSENLVDHLIKTAERITKIEKDIERIFSIIGKD